MPKPLDQDGRHQRAKENWSKPDTHFGQLVVIRHSLLMKGQAGEHSFLTDA